MKGDGKTHCSNNFAEYLRKSDVSENSNFYYGRFLRNGLHESFAIFVKVDEMYLEMSASHGY